MSGYIPPEEEWVRTHPELGEVSPQWNPATNVISPGLKPWTVEDDRKMYWFNYNQDSNSVDRASRYVRNVDIPSPILPDGMRMQRHLLVDQELRNFGAKRILTWPFKYRYEMTYMTPHRPSRELCMFLLNIAPLRVIEAMFRALLQLCSVSPKYRGRFNELKELDIGIIMADVNEALREIV